MVMSHELGNDLKVCGRDCLFEAFVWRVRRRKPEHRTVCRKGYFRTTYRPKTRYSL